MGVAGAASPGPFWAAADKKPGDTSCVPRPCCVPGGTRPAPRPPGLFFTCPWPAGPRTLSAPHRQAAPFQTVSGLCPALTRAAPPGRSFQTVSGLCPALTRAAPPGRSFPGRFRLVPGAHARRAGLAAPSRTVSGLCPALQARRAVWPLLSKPFPACARCSRTPRRLAALPGPFPLVPGAHARRAVWPLLPGPFPACARRSRAPRRQAARRTSAPFPEAHAAHARPSPGAHAARETRIGAAGLDQPAFPRPKCP